MYYLTKTSNHQFYDSTIDDWVDNPQEATLYNSLIELLPYILFLRYEFFVTITTSSTIGAKVQPPLTYETKTFIRAFRNFCLNSTYGTNPNIPSMIDDFGEELLNLKSVPRFIAIVHAEKNTRLLTYDNDDELMLMKLEHDVMGTWKPDWEEYFGKVV